MYFFYDNDFVQEFNHSKIDVFVHNGLSWYFTRFASISIFIKCYILLSVLKQGYCNLINAYTLSFLNGLHAFHLKSNWFVFMNYQTWILTIDTLRGHYCMTVGFYKHLYNFCEFDSRPWGGVFDTAFCFFFSDCLFLAIPQIKLK